MLDTDHMLEKEQFKLQLARSPVVRRAQLSNVQWAQLETGARHMLEAASISEAVRFAGNSSFVPCTDVLLSFGLLLFTDFNDGATSGHQCTSR